MLSLSTIADDTFFHISHFLSLPDIFSLELSCKSLNHLCRKPNAIKYLLLPCKNINNFENNRYSTIKTLNISIIPQIFRGNINDDRSLASLIGVKFHNKWQSSVTQLIVNNRGCHNLPNFLRLERFACSSNKNVAPFMRKINKNTLTVLELDHVFANFELFEGIVQCINIEKLSLLLHWKPHRRAKVEEMNDLYHRIDERIKPNLANHSLNKLQHFETSLAMNNMPHLFHWILGGTHAEKHLVIDCRRHSRILKQNSFYLFDTESNTKAFKTISNITIISDIFESAELALWRNIYSLLSHEKHNVLISREDIIYMDKQKKSMENDIDLMMNMLPHWKHSNLLYQFNIYLFPDLDESFLDTKQLEMERNEWLLAQIINGNRSQWFEAFTVVFKVWYGGLLDDGRYLIDRCQTEDDLKEFGMGAALGLIEQYDRFVKPWLVINGYVMQKVGMKCFEVLLDLECLTPRGEELKLFWKEQVIPMIEKEVARHCDDVCILDTAVNPIKLSFKCVTKNHTKYKMTETRRQVEMFKFR
eukprot:175625_1